MFVNRTLQPLLLALFDKYPIVSVTGPRQSGKTTLCRTSFPELAYVNLERPDVRDSAIADPRAFLARCGEGAVIDEIQRAPELLSWIQVHVDELRRNRLFVLTGSEQFAFSESLSQSLAGRTAILKLLPFSIREARAIRSTMSIDEMLFTGFYPRIYDQQLDPTRALGDYFETYVERDVRRLSEIRDLSTFQRFVRLCAGRIGQLLNLHSLGNDAGVSQPTARHWISVLEASFIVFLLPPFHPNVSKRLIKSPKLYFHDVGLASYLLGIENTRQMETHPLRGALFENLVVAEALKFRTNSARRSNLHFYRDSSGLEIDLIHPVAERVVAIEIKGGRTVASSFFDALTKFRQLLGEGVAAEILVTGVEEDEATPSRRAASVIGPAGLEGALESLDPPSPV
ncbi:MAG TPA: ATP-binding protein [Thermoanaerobaculia bacterium]|nr:ATP-binding protein [Thermoanaerobaculia bacterium]